MREIKFRGKSIKTGEWHYGSLLTDNTDWACITDTLPNNEVNPETVGEFTGFKDIDGKEIFEGDIVEWFLITGERQINCIVYALNGCADFSFDPTLTLTESLITNYKVKVIGNFHDNPELLKGGNHYD